MTPDQLSILLLIVTALALFIWDRWRYDVVALATLLAAVVLDLVPAREAFSGFGHPATITVAAILVLSHTLARTGASAILADIINRATSTLARHVAVLSSLGALMSSVMNNVAALGLLIPAAIQSTENTRYGAGAVLMPLSFATILGGLVTLIGTPPNIIIAVFRNDELGAPFTMFDFTPVGLAVTAAGVAFLTFGAQFLIPRRRLMQTTIKRHMNIDKFIAEARVVKNSTGHGMTWTALIAAADEANVRVVNLTRRGRRFRRLPEGDSLKVGDRLLLESAPQGLEALTKSLEFKVGTRRDAKADRLISGDMDLIEAVVRPGSRMEGRDLETLRLHYRYDTDILAVSRQGQPHRGRLGRFRFRSGDVVLFYGPRDQMPDLLDRMGCLALMDRGVQLGEVGKHHARLALGLFAAAIAASTLGLIPLTVALCLAAVLMVVLGLLPVREIYDGIDWPVILLIGSLIPVGTAFEATGTSDLIAETILDTPLPNSPMLVMVLLMIVTMALSNVLNNAATAVIMAPVALTLAARLGANPDAFLMATAVAASAAFVTPVGHQNNALVMGPAGYTFGDFWRLGLPLQILVLAVATPMIMTVWPF